MTTQAVTLSPMGEEATARTIESAVIRGDLKDMTVVDRVNYYRAVCESLGLNPFTKPFEYIVLNQKLTLYARKDCAEQLRKLHNVTTRIVGRVTEDGLYIVTAEARLPNGRCEEAIGAVAVEGLKGELRANALMKAETKAKRRVTLAICGLGFFDQTEVESDLSGDWNDDITATSYPPARVSDLYPSEDLGERRELPAAPVGAFGWPDFWLQARDRYQLDHAAIHTLFGLASDKGALKALCEERGWSVSDAWRELERRAADAHAAAEEQGSDEPARCEDCGNPAHECGCGPERTSDEDAEAAWQQRLMETAPAERTVKSRGAH